MIKRMIKQGRHSVSGWVEHRVQRPEDPPPDHLEWVKPAHLAGAKLDGGRPERKGVAVQHSGRALLPLPSEPAGLLWILASRRNAWVEDLVVGTVVVYDWPTARRTRHPRRRETTPPRAWPHRRPKGEGHQHAEGGIGRDRAVAT